jgi:arginyl-tRNA synthetase
LYQFEESQTNRTAGQRQRSEVTVVGRSFDLECIHGINSDLFPCGGMSIDILELKERLASQLNEAAVQAQKQGLLPSVSLPDTYLEHPQKPEHGDYASSFPLKLARATGIRPMQIAETLVKLMSKPDEVEEITAAPPGFINFRLSAGWLSDVISSILTLAESYANIAVGNGQRVQIEFVSANPTGPLHVGNGRGAVLGSALANIMQAAGYRVEKEYYVNDAGSQTRAFYKSLYARYQQCLGKDMPLPENGYQGTYVIELAQEIIKEKGEGYLLLPESEAVAMLGELGLQKMIDRIKADLAMLGVQYDNWFSERSLFDKGQFNTVMARLHDGGYIAQKEKATWFMSTALGEDKDNVVIRTDGTPTYFGTDIAYHYNKFLERKLDRVIDIWGADHQGHVTRMKAVVSALGVDPDRLTILISQMVTLKRGAEVVRLSKRTGDIITLREVVEEVGSDACRFFFMSRSADSQMDFDLELAKKQSAENPVYYVQYAHARIASILRLAGERGIDFSDGDATLLTADPELVLIRKLALLPEIIETAAQALEPHHLTYYAQDVATVFHAFYRDCRVISEDAALTAARLKLVSAAKIVLARTLHLMGMSAPDRM